MANLIYAKEPSYNLWTVAFNNSVVDELSLAHYPTLQIYIKCAHQTEGRSPPKSTSNRNDIGWFYTPNFQASLSFA